MHGEIDIIVHATEDLNRILDSVKSILKVQVEKFDRRDLSGHYGNPVTYIKIKLHDEDVKSLLNVIKNNMPTEDMYYLQNLLDEYVTRNIFYLRLDKQALCKGKLKLVINDPIKIVIKNVKIDFLKKIFIGINDSNK